MDLHAACFSRQEDRRFLSCVTAKELKAGKKSVAIIEIWNSPLEIKRLDTLKGTSFLRGVCGSSCAGAKFEKLMTTTQ